MWRQALALVACCAVVGSPIALADAGNSTPTPTIEAQAPPPCAGRAELRRAFAHSRWRRGPAAHPPPCSHAQEARLRASFRTYRAYRRLAHYRGFREGDEYLAWLPIPAYIVACETRGYRGEGRWLASNTSGAQGPAQLIGWGAPNPARTDAQKLAYWRAAARARDEQGFGAWECA